MGPVKDKPQLKKSGKIGRNSLCPCKSGLKYKHCHGNERFRVMCQRAANEAAQNMMMMLIQQTQAQKGICPSCKEKFKNKRCEKCNIDFLTKDEAAAKQAEERNADQRHNKLVVPSKKIILPSDLKGK